MTILGKNDAALYRPPDPPNPPIPSKGVYPPVPELDWLKSLVQELQAEPIMQQEGDRLWTVYKFLLWQRRAAIIPHIQQPEHRVCYAFSMKYHRKLYGIPLCKAEEMLLAEAMDAYKQRKGAGQ